MKNNAFSPPDYDEIQRRVKNENSGSYWGGYFKPGVFGSTPSQKKSFSGRILPMFDYSLSPADLDFQKSFFPYRDVNKVDLETNQPKFTAWFGVANAYSWFGNKAVSFLSPTTLRFTHGISSGPDVLDPIMEIRKFAKKHEDPAIRALTERVENKKDAKVIIPYPQLRYFFNFYGTAGADRNVKNYVLDVSKKAFEDLCDKLSEWRPSHEKVLDADWSQYLFGDITNPSNGIVVDTVPIPSNPQPFNGFVFTTGSHKSLKGVRQMPVPEEALIKRVQFYGDSSAFKILPAQDIVNFLVEDGAIPYELVNEVCSDFCNVPPQPKRNTFVSEGHIEEAEEDLPFVPDIPTAPAKSYVSQYQEVSSPPAAPPSPPPHSKLFWVSEPGMPTLKMPETEIAEKIKTNQLSVSEASVCLVGESEWKTLKAAGFSSASDNESAPPPPPTRSAPVVSMTPSVAPVVSTKVGYSTETIPSPSSSNASSNEALTAEEVKEKEELEEKFREVGASMHPATLTRMVFLRKKAGCSSAIPE